MAARHNSAKDTEHKQPEARRDDPATVSRAEVAERLGNLPYADHPVIARLLDSDCQRVVTCAEIRQMRLKNRNRLPKGD